MTERNVTRPSPLQNRAAGPAPMPLNTPLVWAWGGVLLTATTWLTAVIAFVHSIGSLFD